MTTISTALYRAVAGRLPLLALAAALLGTACGSSSTNLVAPTTSKCQISVTGFTGNFGPSGGSGTATIDTARECSWSAQSGAAWITLASPAGGSGSGTLRYSVQPNDVPRGRTGSLDVNAQRLTVSQAPAPCRFGVTPTTVAMTAAGGTASVSVSANDGSCAWSAASQAPWISVSDPTGGNGSGSLAFSVTANTADARTGTLVVAGQSVTVSEAAVGSTPAPGPPSPGPTPPPTPTPGPTSPVQLVGNVSGRSGDCPTLSFFVQGTAVVTTADTQFVGTACNKVRNGQRVQVDGTQQAGQPVVATRVTRLD